jgi:hypothetical protein
MSEEFQIAWGDLSLDARNVLEWIGNPRTGELHVAEIRVGEYPTFDGKRRDLDHPIVDQSLFDEMLAYVSAHPGYILASFQDEVFTTHYAEYDPAAKPQPRLWFER